MTFGFATAFASSQKSIDFDFIKSVKDAGYDYIELSGILIGSLQEESFSLLLKYLAEINLKCKKICSLLSGNFNCFSSNTEIFNRHLDLLFSRFERLGVEEIGFGSGSARKAPDNWETEKSIHSFAEILNDHFLPRLKTVNIVLNIEPLNSAETNTITSFHDAVQLIELLNDHHFGILADTLHMIKMHEDASLIASAYLGYINHLHVSELKRVLPVVSYSEECHAFLNSFIENGYNKSISFETKVQQRDDLRTALLLIKQFVDRHHQS